MAAGGSISPATPPPPRWNGAATPPCELYPSCSANWPGAPRRHRDAPTQRRPVPTRDASGHPRCLADYPTVAVTSAGGPHLGGLRWTIRPRGGAKNWLILDRRPGTSGGGVRAELV